MKTIKLNIHLNILLGIFIILISNVSFCFGQNDSISIQSHFNKNISELDNLDAWKNENSTPGKFKFAAVENNLENGKSFNLRIFNEELEGASEFYTYLNELPLKEKQNLIRFFTFYEKQIEAILIEVGLPGELKYLAPALSAMNTNAVSKQKAGVWQLTHFQAVLNGLKVDKLVDERLNILLSTKAAAKQIKQNYNIYNNYDLAVLGFLAGNTKTRNVIQRTKEHTNLVEMLGYFPSSVKEKIAAFQAVSVFLSANKFVETVDLLAKNNQPDTVKIYKEMHFQQIEKVLGISVKQLSYLNPQFKFLIIPENKKATKLALPEGSWDDFVMWQDSIQNSYDSTLFQMVAQKIEYPPAPNRQYLGEPVKDLEIEGKTKLQYRIKSGDVLGLIAEKYDVRVADLKYWNNIYNERKIQAGNKLDIFVDDENAAFYISLEKPIEKKVETLQFAEQFQKSATLKVLEDLERNANKIEHIVKSGESPYHIAKKYEGVTPEQILEWNGIDDARKIQIGQKLMIYLKK